MRRIDRAASATARRSRAIFHAGILVVLLGGLAASIVVPSRVTTADTAIGTWLPSASGRVPVVNRGVGVPLINLLDGTVLAAGGSVNMPGSAIYNPVTWTWSELTLMQELRSGHQATRLSDGRVLVSGGVRTRPGTLELELVLPAEIYDPATQSWTETGSLNEGRRGHVSVLLPDASVLVAGGYVTHYGVPSHVLSSAERFDPLSGTWQLIAPMTQPRYEAAAVSLTNGDVLVIGGADKLAWENSWVDTAGTNTAEIFDPSTGAWYRVGNMVDTRWLGSAAVLRDGRVLAASLPKPANDPDAQPATAELFDPVTRSWTSAGDLLGEAAPGLASALLPSGRVVLAGGCYQLCSRPTPMGTTVQVYDPAEAAWLLAAQAGKHSSIGKSTVIQLTDGSVLLVGGGDEPARFFELTPTPSVTPTPSTTPSPTITPTPSTTLTPTPSQTFTPSITPTPSITRTPRPTNSPTLTPSPTEVWQRVGHWRRVASPKVERLLGMTATLLRDGRVLVAGGVSTRNFSDFPVAPGTFTAAAEIYDPMTNSWSPTGRMNVPRRYHYAHLNNLGQVIILGGRAEDGSHTNVIEQFDPDDNSWNIMTVVPDSYEPFGMGAVAIDNDLLLVTGFWESRPACDSRMMPDTLVLNVRDGTWSAGPPIHVGRQRPQMARLADESILMAGGTERYEFSHYGCQTSQRHPKTTELLSKPYAQFVTVGSTRSEYNTSGRMVALSNGSAALTANLERRLTLELYDPVRRLWMDVVSTGRMWTFIMLEVRPGQLMLLGGGTPLVDIYDVANDRWLDAGPMHEVRRAGAAVRLLDGRVFVVGGDEHGSAEVFSFDMPPNDRSTIYLPTTIALAVTPRAVPGD